MQHVGATDMKRSHHQHGKPQPTDTCLTTTSSTQLCMPPAAALQLKTAQQVAVVLAEGRPSVAQLAALSDQVALVLERHKPAEVDMGEWVEGLREQGRQQGAGDGGEEGSYSSRAAREREAVQQLLVVVASMAEQVGGRGVVPYCGRTCCVAEQYADSLSVAFTPSL